jgi:hypothetical protein
MNLVPLGSGRPFTCQSKNRKHITKLKPKKITLPMTAKTEYCYIFQINNTDI